jgi:hypothetical protein
MDQDCGRDEKIYKYRGGTIGGWVPNVCNNSTCRAIKRNKRLLPPPLITWEAVDGEIQCDCGARLPP